MTSDFLAGVVAHKRQEVAARRAATPLATLRRRATPSTRSFRTALTMRRPALILECKQRSPSLGALRPQLVFDEIADAYRGVADAVSVLTDARAFGGDLSHLAALRARLDQPLLCKDFVVDPYQVVEARAHGADAILLMLSVLDDDGWRACMAEVAMLGMEALTEVHDASEMARARALGATIVGINNRELGTLAVDLATTARLAPLAPPGALLIAESGIADRDDLRRIAPLVDGVLVGSSLMRAPDLWRAARTLAYGRFKVCGLTRPEDARAAAACGAFYMGLNFVRGSPRVLDLATATRIAATGPLVPVGVFADAPLAEVVRVARALPLAAVQLHGAEDLAYLAALRRRLPPAARAQRQDHGEVPSPSPAIIEATWVP